MLVERAQVGANMRMLDSLHGQPLAKAVSDECREAVQFALISPQRVRRRAALIGQHAQILFDQRIMRSAFRGRRSIPLLGQLFGRLNR